MAVAIFIVAVIIILFLLDYTLGKWLSKKQLQERVYPLRRGQLILFSNGAALYKDLFHEIEQASHEIHILFYTVRSDGTSKEFLEKLEQKAKQGIAVRLLLDWAGSF
ncbi:hypothetical protein ACFOU2_24005 [Bacillus songklensis]|uniref:Cardiolipin synthase n=1 Tax=Bacillus songklensis TaxID=1069116 RepID=A0ABV8B7T3_9BACI